MKQLVSTKFVRKTHPCRLESVPKNSLEEKIINKNKRTVSNHPVTVLGQIDIFP